MEYLSELDSLEPSLKNLTDGDFGKLKNSQHQPLQDLIKPHIESFNWFLHTGIYQCIQDLLTEFEMPNKDQVALYIKSIDVSKPDVVTGKNLLKFKSEKLYPAECRQRGLSYTGEVIIELGWKLNDIDQTFKRLSIGYLPIMVKSDYCNLNGLNPKELINKGEEAEELGGYFISNGIEKIIRLLILQRRNYPMAIERFKWKDFGAYFTEYGVVMRCTQPDQTSSNIILHYLTNGSAILSFSLLKQNFFIPVIMLIRALVTDTDYSIFKQMLQGMEDKEFVSSCCRNMLKQMHEEGLASRLQVLNYIGNLFRYKLDLPDWYTDQEVTLYLIKKCICIHLSSNKDKANILIHMCRKLFSFAKSQCAPESPDNPMLHEVLLPGHLIQLLFKEKLADWLNNLKLTILKNAKKRQTSDDIVVTFDDKLLFESLRKVSDISNSLNYFISTGNVSSKSGLGLMQNAGMTVVADKLNFFRYLSHFRAVHRGAFFTTMRTTAVRKLNPETWGFLCPVHTPDGSPCGLLNHLAYTCQIVTLPVDNLPVQRQLISLGVDPCNGPILSSLQDHYAVLVDGKMVGWVSAKKLNHVAKQMRSYKVLSEDGISNQIEIIVVPKRDVPAQYPGLYIFTTAARMVRPVMNLSLNKIELIGTFEQVYLNICLQEKDAYENLTTHKELNQFVTLSEMAALTPFSNFNQSCRNMYQCQMGKQTMGIPLHAWKYRNDHKLYRLSCPQTPLVRTSMYDYLNMDDYPLGTNAIIAVMAYTGYDMEDAMVINKSSYERGFAFGSIYKMEVANLKGLSSNRTDVYEFGSSLNDPKVVGKLDSDGMPFVGSIVQQDDPLYSYLDTATGHYSIVKYKGSEIAYIDSVKMCSDMNVTSKCSIAYIGLRIQRNPVIGDKLSSRHGQKGICSQFYPCEDMPFTSKGMTPDIIFNPHGFPSRMTIGKIVEIMAGKSATCHGIVHNSSPFLFNEENDPIKYFEECLSKAGFNYYGTEVLHSGIKGNVLEAYIFMGVVYYQRLRHMVLDKWQVRTTGSVDQVTQQPIGGRKRGGGVRFGEMERDALIAHGAAFLLQDRLLNCSDSVQMTICTKCGSILSPIFGPPDDRQVEQGNWIWKCLVCSPENPKIGVVTAPFILRYLCAELASANIKLKFDVRQE